MNEPSKPWYRQLPAKAGAVVVFMVAVTTLAGNLMELNNKRRQPEPAVTTPAPGVDPAAPATPPLPAPAGPVKLRLVLDRIVSEHDGSPGTTDWRFTLEAEGEPLLAFQQDDLDDTGGRNVASLRDVDAILRLAAGRDARITVKGWRASRFRLPGTEPDAKGQGMLTPAGVIAPIRVSAKEARGGAFLFYLSVDPG